MYIYIYIYILIFNEKNKQLKLLIRFFYVGNETTERNHIPWISYGKNKVNVSDKFRDRYNFSVILSRQRVFVGDRSGGTRYINKNILRLFVFVKIYPCVDVLETLEVNLKLFNLSLTLWSLDCICILLSLKCWKFQIDNCCSL